MLQLVATNSPMIAISDQSFWNDQCPAARRGGYFDRESTWSRIHELRVGAVLYPLRSALEMRFIPGRGELLVDGLSPPFIGRGQSQEESLEDWKGQVHARFQELFRKRPFEMAAAETRDWKLLTDLIDVTVFRNTTPILVRQFGTVSKARPRPTEITWENGSKESISIEQVDSPDFVIYMAGQALEAIVSRDPVSFALNRIVHVERRNRPIRPAAQDEKELMRSLGSSRTLTRGDWE